LLVSARTRTVSPSTHSRPASVELRTSFRLAPSRGHQQVLRPPGGEDARCVRPISATQTNHVHPHLVAFPVRSRSFRRGDVLRSLGLRRADRGTGCFTTPRTASADRHRSRLSCPWCLTASERERGRFLPTVVDAIEPLTPLSRSPRSPSRLRRFRVCCHLAVCPAPRLERRFDTGRRVGRPPRPPFAPSRESRRFVMIRDVFRR